MMTYSTHTISFKILMKTGWNILSKNVLPKIGFCVFTIYKHNYLLAKPSTIAIKIFSIFLLTSFIPGFISVIWFCVSVLSFFHNSLSLEMKLTLSFKRAKFKYAVVNLIMASLDAVYNATLILFWRKYFEKYFLLCSFIIFLNSSSLKIIYSFFLHA